MTPAPIDRKLFGTDGIRGEAGRYPLDPVTLRRLGAALAEVLVGSGLGRRVLLARDTRSSGPAIMAALSGGLQAHSIEVVQAGVLPTPAVAQLVAGSDFAAGIAISASHNPYQDNGIKIFSGEGYKLPDALEARIEGLLKQLPESDAGQEPNASSSNGNKSEMRRRYVDQLLAALPSGRPLSGMSVVLDCGQGAAHACAPEAFRHAGAQVIALGNQPNGRNINQDCGALHPEVLARRVLDEGAQLGAAFDGDADRAIFVDETGSVRDGDYVLAILAPRLHAQGRLGGNQVIGTVMSNIGLELALAENSIGLVRAPVGDKYVLEEMQRRGARLGGEPSGHVIFQEYATTGDGLLTALLLAGVMAETDRSLSALCGALTKAPQLLLNLRVDRRAPLEELQAWREAMNEVEAELGKTGRVVVRFSGTEPLLRVMVESQDAELTRRSAERLVETAQKLLK